MQGREKARELGRNFDRLLALALLGCISKMARILYRGVLPGMRMFHANSIDRTENKTG